MVLVVYVLATHAQQIKNIDQSRLRNQPGRCSEHRVRAKLIRRIQAVRRLPATSRRYVKYTQVRQHLLPLFFHDFRLKAQ